MNSVDPRAIAYELLSREGYYLDDRDWDDWVGLYHEDAVYWVPAWRDEMNEISNPDSEVSQIYHADRRGLEERVSRIRSGSSVTTMPLPRTTHFTSNILAVARDARTVDVRASWMVQVYQPRTAHHYTNFGDYEFTLAERGSEWRIAAKTIHLKNDLIPALIDFYTL